MIKTFAFVDLETTGLPELEFYKTKITELSIVACSTEHLMETKSPNIPRVLHKLTLCLNPCKRIDFKSTEITRLHNDLLEHENKFDQNVMTLLESFMGHLQQPICLIAHNGTKFDFPLIKKQYDLLNGTFPETTLCCDSLPIFQRIDELILERQKVMEKQLKLLRDSYILQQWDHMKDAELEINAKIEELMETLDQKLDYFGNDMIFKTLVSRELEMIVKQKQIMSSENTINKILEKSMEQIGEHTDEDGNDNIFKTLVRRELNSMLDIDDNIIKSMQAINETTPPKPTKARNQNPNEKLCDSSTAEHSRKRAISSRRELFSASSSLTTGTRQSPTRRFTLSEIYKRFFNKYPDESHDAESDVICLLKCAVACKRDFIDLAMEHSIDFKDVKKF